MQGVIDEEGTIGKHEKPLDTCKSGGAVNMQRCSSTAAGSDLAMHIGTGGEEKDRFGCTMQVRITMVVCTGSAQQGTPERKWLCVVCLTLLLSSCSTDLVLRGLHVSGGSGA